MLPEHHAAPVIALQNAGTRVSPIEGRCLRRQVEAHLAVMQGREKELTGDVKKLTAQLSELEAQLTEDETPSEDDETAEEE